MVLEASRYTVSQNNRSGPTSISVFELSTENSSDGSTFYVLTVISKLS